MLSIPNYYRSDDDQNDNEKSNPIWRNGYPNSLQTVHGEESREMTETPFMFPGNKHWQQPLEGTACTGQNKKVKRTKPKILIPTPGPTLQKTVVQNDTSFKMTQPSMQWFLQLPRNRLKKSSTDRLNLKEMLYIYTRSYYSDFKYRHWNYEVIPVVPTRMYLGGKYAKRN